MSKRLYLLLFAFLAGFSMTIAQTWTISVSGQVTETGTGSPIANHDVYIMFDSTYFPYWGTGQTDAAGNYGFTVTGVTPTQGNFWVYLYDCNGAYVSSPTMTYGGVLTNFPGVDFQICNSGGSTNCLAGFTASTVQGSTVVNFADQSSAGAPTASIVSYAWDFGDGNSSTAQNPSHAYNSVGPFTVCLTITTSAGCTATYCDSLLVGSGGGGNCAANFMVQGSGCTFSFQDSSYTANGPLTYLWDFGDGSTGTGALATHTYTTGGVYTVCLSIADANGCTDTYCQTVAATCGGGGGGCAASYTWYPDTTGQYTIIIVNTSTGNSLSYFWDFGDGSTSTQANPSHVYNGPSNYAVCVTVIDSTPGNTCVSTFCDTIAVLNRMNVPFSINVISGTVNVDQQVDNVVGMQIAPNPAKDRAALQFSLNQAENTRVQLMDIQGRVVKQLEMGNLSSGAQQTELDLSGLKSGMYLVNVVAGQQRFTKKLIISE